LTPTFSTTFPPLERRAYGCFRCGDIFIPPTPREIISREMSEDHRDASHASSDGARRGRPSHANRYAWLLGSGVALVLGGLSLPLTGLLSVGVYVPIGLVILGFGLLTVALIPRSAGNRPAPDSSTASRHSPVVDPTDSPAVTRPREARPAVNGHPRMVFSTAVPRIRSLPTALSQHDSGDFLWDSGNPSVGRLSAELVGPVPRAASVPPRPAEGAQYERGEPILLGPSHSDDENLDWRWENYVADSADKPTRSFTTKVPAESEFEPSPRRQGPENSAWHDGGSLLLQNPNGVSAAQEAHAATPPHLRSNPRSTEINAHPRTLAPTVPARSARCANCRARIAEPKAWRRCPDCQHPLCTHCIVEALLAYEGAWCTHCAGLRHMDLLSNELGPAGRIAPTMKTRHPTPPVRRQNTPMRITVGGAADVWKEPDWFVKIPSVRTRSPQSKVPVPRQVHSRSESGRHLENRGHGPSSTPRAGRPGLPVAGK
jgi:hypothetical protein